MTRKGGRRESGPSASTSGSVSAPVTSAANPAALNLEHLTAWEKDLIYRAIKPMEDRIRALEAENAALKAAADCPHFCEVCGGHLRKSGTECEWKARAEKAEARVAELEAAIISCMEDKIALAERLEEVSPGDVKEVLAPPARSDPEPKKSELTVHWCTALRPPRTVVGTAADCPHGHQPPPGRDGEEC